MENTFPAPQERSETALKWLSHLPAVLTALLGIATFAYSSWWNASVRSEDAQKAREAQSQVAQQDRMTRLEEATMERRRKFLDRQMELYFDATQQAAILASTRSRTQWEQAYRRFWQLYWGNLSIVESPFSQKNERAVENRMVRFGGLLQSTEGDFSRVTRTMREASQAREGYDGLEQMSLQLARACREDLQETMRYMDQKSDALR